MGARFFRSECGDRRHPRAARSSGAERHHRDRCADARKSRALCVSRGQAASARSVPRAAVASLRRAILRLRGTLMAARKTRLQLGRAVAIPESPDKAVLDAVPNPHSDVDYVVRFTAPEFTTLCPITGQPDFAHFVIDYAPGRQLLE